MDRLLSLRRGRSRAAYASAIGLALLSLVAGPAAAASPTIFNTNLVTNPGFEAGSASTDGYSGVTVPGWIVTGTPTVIPYGTQNRFPLPTATESARIGGGQQFFAAGAPSSGKCGSISQTISVTGRNALVDNHHIRVVVSGWMATSRTQVDNAVVRLRLFDSSDAFLGSLVLPVQSATNRMFRHLTASRVLPSKTRALTITLKSTAHEGAYCNAYFDKISVTLVRV